MAEPSRPGLESRVADAAIPPPASCTSHSQLNALLQRSAQPAPPAVGPPPGWGQALTGRAPGPPDPIPDLSGSSGPQIGPYSPFSAPPTAWPPHPLPVPPGYEHLPPPPAYHGSSEAVQAELARLSLGRPPSLRPPGPDAPVPRPPQLGLRPAPHGADPALLPPGFGPAYAGQEGGREAQESRWGRPTAYWPSPLPSQQQQLQDIVQLLHLAALQRQGRPQAEWMAGRTEGLKPSPQAEWFMGRMGEGLKPPPNAFAHAQHGLEEAMRLAAAQAAAQAPHQASSELVDPTLESTSPPPSPKLAPSGSSERGDRWVDIMDLRHDGRRPTADMALLDADLRALAADLRPLPAETRRQLRAFEAVRGLLLGRFPRHPVRLFGSVANGLSVRGNNDLDVCLEHDGGERDVLGAVAVEVGELLRVAGMDQILVLPKARVPVVKFVVPSAVVDSLLGGADAEEKEGIAPAPAPLHCDVVINHGLGSVNTQLLATYCAVDARLPALVALVKRWAKARRVNSPYHGTLSSYAYVLLCVFHLQTRSPPVLPVLQDMEPTFRARVGGWDCAFCDDQSRLRDFGAANKESLAELLWTFFEQLAWDPSLNRTVVSVRTGRRLSKASKGWVQRIGTERHLLCIEDPLDTSHDLGRTVDAQTRGVLHKEFARAATILRDRDRPLAVLFETYEPRAEGSRGAASRGGRGGRAKNPGRGGGGRAPLEGGQRTAPLGRPEEAGVGPMGAGLGVGISQTPVELARPASPPPPPPPSRPEQPRRSPASSPGKPVALPLPRTAGGRGGGGRGAQNGRGGGRFSAAPTPPQARPKP